MVLEKQAFMDDIMKQKTRIKEDAKLMLIEKQNFTNYIDTQETNLSVKKQEMNWEYEHNKQ